MMRYFVVVNGTGGDNRICSTEEEMKWCTKYAPEAKVYPFRTYEEANRFVSTKNTKTMNKARKGKSKKNKIQTVVKIDSDTEVKELLNQQKLRNEKLIKTKF